ncbi:hypothetical protein F4803DRAFT_571174 [Xylaria telfairii]|nr:hypothetical protein F4803DRAFT_571174 [Xylaria telfairii]
MIPSHTPSTSPRQTNIGSNLRILLNRITTLILPSYYTNAERSPLHLPTQLRTNLNSTMSPISKTKATLQRMFSKGNSSGHDLLTQSYAQDSLTELLREVQIALNLTPMEQAVEDTLGYDTEDTAPMFSIIPIEKILSLPWRAGEYQIEHILPPPDDDLATASIRTITSQCAGNARWECERLAAFLRAKNQAFDSSSTSVVVLARPNDPWKLKKENADHMALMQIVGSLITVFLRYLPEGIPPSLIAGLTDSNVSKFSAHNDLDAGLAILTAFPPLSLDGKSLFLIIDMSDVRVSEDSPSKDHRNLIEALVKIAALNRATLIRVETGKTGADCFIHGPGATNQRESKNLHVIYDSTQDK